MIKRKAKKTQPISTLLDCYHIGVNPERYSLKQWTSTFKELGASLQPLPPQFLEIIRLQPHLIKCTRSIEEEDGLEEATQNSKLLAVLPAGSLVLIGQDAEFKDELPPCLKSYTCVKAEIYIAACKSKKSILPTVDFIWGAVGASSSDRNVNSTKVSLSSSCSLKQSFSSSGSSVSIRKQSSHRESNDHDIDRSSFKITYLKLEIAKDVLRDAESLEAEV
jgi:hypothetical protein